MKSLKRVLTMKNLLGNFPSEHPSVLDNQRAALEIIAGAKGPVTLEMPTGSGKTAVGYTFLKTLAAAGAETLFYIVPTKALVDQVKAMHPEVTAVYGRNEYDCLYYEPKESFKADEIPCLSLDCPHRVDQQDGSVQDAAATPCPYYRAKFEAKRSRIVVCTAAFYLFTQLFSKEFERPDGLVIDEAHQIAEIFRNALSYEITDWHLARSIKLLERVGADEAAGKLDAFLRAMLRILKRRQRTASQQRLLEDHELLQLTDNLEAIDLEAVRGSVNEAVASGKIDPMKDRLVLKQLETVTQQLPRYVRSLEFARETYEHRPLNYVTYGYSERPEDELVNYKLVIKASYVVPLVRKVLSPLTVVMSATIGDPTVFGYDTGIKAECHSLPGTFPSERTRVFLPSDTPDLAKKVRPRQEPTKVLRKIARTCARLDTAGERSLVIVVSNREREKFLWLCDDEGVDAISYGNGVPSREAMARFKAGEGSVLVGTAANYGEGIDLPEGMASVAFVLRPGYPNPADPRTQFERRRYGGQAWMVWSWRAMIAALQARGRNVRSAEDRGVTIFVSQQFRRFLYASLPEWLQEAYAGNLTLEECEEETLELLQVQ